jgi:hypothetical protein
MPLTACLYKNPTVICYHRKIDNRKWTQMKINIIIIVFIRGLSYPLFLFPLSSYPVSSFLFSLFLFPITCPNIFPPVLCNTALLLLAPFSGTRLHK